jgi:hypothetical protein
MLIDPPHGWAYGFPKKLPNPPPENLYVWLVEQGYPEEEIKTYGNYFFCRYIAEDTDESK